MSPIKIPKNKKQRSSVSAEVYGMFNRKEDFKPRVIPKSSKQIENISKRLSQAFMFSNLDDREKNVVINAMEERQYELKIYKLEPEKES